jgi:hypothetical protein
MKFKIYTINEAGEQIRYKPPKGEMIVMNSQGIFFVYNSEPFYPSIMKLYDKIGHYEVVWEKEEELKPLKLSMLSYLKTLEL